MGLFILWVAYNSLYTKWCEYNFWTKTFGLVISLDIETWWWMGCPRRPCVSQASGYRGSLCPFIEVQSPGNLQTGWYVESTTWEAFKNHKCPGPTPDYKLEPWEPTVIPMQSPGSLCLLESYEAKELKNMEADGNVSVRQALQNQPWRARRSLDSKRRKDWALSESRQF